MPAQPCSTCPYRRDTPPGLWAAEEYRKLAEFDPQPDGPGPLKRFHCHQQAPGRPTLCRGWLAVHGTDSPAVRLAIACGEVTVDDATAPVDVDLYSSGTEAAAAGLAGVLSPPPEAAAAQRRLLTRKAGNRLRVAPPEDDDTVLTALNELQRRAAAPPGRRPGHADGPQTR